MTNRARRRRHIPRHPLAVRIRSGFIEILLQEIQNPLKLKTLLSTGFFAGGRGLFFSVGIVLRRIAVQQHVLNTWWEFIEWSVERKSMRVPRQFQSALQRRR